MIPRNYRPEYLSKVGKENVINLGIKSFLIMISHRPKSEELKEAQEIAENGIELALEELPKEDAVEVGYGWTEDDFTKEQMNGARGLCWNSTYFELEFNTEINGWKKALVGSSVHEFAHAYFAEQKDIDEHSDKPIWMYILEEALTQNITEKIVPEAPEPWRYEHSINEISDYWREIKEEELDRQYEYPDKLFVDREGESYPNWLGYSLSYQIGQKLMEEDYELSEFPHLEKDDVINAGDELFK